MLRQKRILFWLNLAAGLVCLSFAIYLFCLQQNTVSAVLCTAGLVYAGNAWLASKEETGISAVVAIVVSDLLVMLFDSGILHDSHNTFVFYVPILLFTYVVTRYDERYKRALMMAFTVACIITINFTNFTPKLLAGYEVQNMNNTFKLVNTGVAIFLSVAIIRTISKVNRSMETQLVAAKEIAERSSDERMRFLSIMSHELRTPANAIVGMSHLLLEKEVPDDLRRDVSLLHYSAQSLKSIVENILYFNKLEDGGIQLDNKPLDVRRFCRDAVDSFVLEAAKKNIELYFSYDDRIPQYLLCDAEKLRLIVNNLLHNAIKFTRRGSIHFWVKLNHMDDDACFVLFKLADTGVGIKEGRLKDIFNVFSQLNNKITRSYDGMGLGLAISSKLVEVMGGTIHVDSEEGEGSNFYFELKLERTNEIKDDDQMFIETHDLAGLKILLVEDNKLNVLVAKKILNAMHAEVDVAADGIEGLRVYADKDYDLILMDLHMPRMDGFDTARRIREENEHIPIIAFSADAFEDAKLKAKAAGMNDFISKPFDPAVLYDKIRRYGKN